MVAGAMESVIHERSGRERTADKPEFSTPGKDPYRRIRDGSEGEGLTLRGSNNSSQNSEDQWVRGWPNSFRKGGLSSS